MTQITALPIASSAPHDWWRRVATAVNLLLGEVSDLATRPSRSVTGAYAVADSDFALIVDASAGAVTITLPAPTKGRELVVKRIDGSSNSVTLSGPVDGASTTQMTAQWQSYTLLGGSDRWYVV